MQFNLILLFCSNDLVVKATISHSVNPTDLLTAIHR